MRSKRSFWLILSIITALIFALTALRYQYQTPYTVNDDTRQHLFWMMRFLDPELFPNDLIADYFQSIAPSGFSFLYKFFTFFKVNPFFVGKFLPIFLLIITTFYCFKVVQQIFPIPFAGFISSLLLNQNLFLRDDIYSSTPRAFIYPLFLAFLYYLLNGSLTGILITIACQGLFYPHSLLISIIILLIRIFCGKQQLFKLDKLNFICYLISLSLAIIIILAYGLKTSNFGTLITAQQARVLPEFLPQGRSYFFSSNPLEFWLYGERSGFLPQEWQYILAFSFGCLVPILKKYPKIFPLIAKVNSKFSVLFQTLIASTFLFILAHLLLFKLHLPSRYTQHTIRTILALADGIFITVLLNSFWVWLRQKNINRSRFKAVGLSALICLITLPSYAASNYPERLSYVTGSSPEMYSFLKKQPKSSLIASLTSETNFIPTFAQRSVLTAEEYAIPYHTGYYKEIRQRTKDLISSQYSLKLEDLQNFIRKYRIDFWLLEQDSFRIAYIANNAWLMQFQPEANYALDTIKTGEPPALKKIFKECAVLEENELILVASSCILQP
jgi:hypothetical protein